MKAFSFDFAFTFFVRMKNKKCELYLVFSFCFSFLKSEKTNGNKNWFERKIQKKKYFSSICNSHFGFNSKMKIRKMNDTWGTQIQEKIVCL